MGKIVTQRASGEKALVFVAFYLQQHLPIFDVDESYTRVISRDHDTVRHIDTVHELDPSDFLALGKLARAIAALDLL